MYATVSFWRVGLSFQRRDTGKSDGRQGAALAAMRVELDVRWHACLGWVHMRVCVHAHGRSVTMDVGVGVGMGADAHVVDVGVGAHVRAWAWVRVWRAGL